MALKQGDSWRSRCLNQEFLVIDGIEQTHPGLGDWSRARFTGFPAHRKHERHNRVLALVDLSEKPPGYPYDFVILSIDP